jgi:4-amino-4-deoxy-L-arabinose transferase-like glycosyltransferase
MTSAEPIAKRNGSPWIFLLVIVLLGLALRLSAAALLPDQGVHLGDAINYRFVGKQFWQTGIMGSDLFMPLYPILIASIGPGWGQLLIDIVLSTSLIWLIYELSITLFADAAAALLAALGVALYPQFIYFAAVGLTEPLFMALFVAALLCWYRGLFVLAAVFAVLSILTRPAIDLLAPVMVLYFSLFIHRLPIGAVAKQFVVYAVIYCALMAPWWIHNYRAYGVFVRLDLAAGENFYAGNNPMNKSGGGIAAVDFQREDYGYSKFTDPVARDRAAWNAGVDYIRQDPAAFLQRAVVKFVRFWRLWPYAENYSNPAIIVMYLLSYAPIFLLTLVYLALWGIPEFLRIAPILGFAGYLTLVNVVFIASLRYRLPIEPFMIMFAATAALRLTRRWPRGKAWLAAVRIDGANTERDVKNSAAARWR